MPESELAFAGVAGQSELLRRGEVSSRELVELSLARIAALDPELNAFGAVYAERARDDADGADARRTAWTQRSAARSTAPWRSCASSAIPSSSATSTSARATSR